ncbi:unnamed protein product [Sphagnum jensenii]|uniref:ABC transporter domain-containing protein n=1 Tax=Sphagnum jensenii TaxID=128206 RepID=A0ABP0VMR1_9BRYO
MDANGDNPGREPQRRTGYATQANALFRKNLALQKRNCRTNTCLISFPIIICLLLFILQLVINKVFNGPDFQCGCQCVPQPGSSTCVKTCGLQYSDSDQVPLCGVSDPIEWPAVLQIPAPEYRAVMQTDYPDLPNPSCRASGTCETTFLYTGQNRSIADNIWMFICSMVENLIFFLSILGWVWQATDQPTWGTEQLEFAFLTEEFVPILESVTCAPNSSFTLDIGFGPQAFQCLENLMLWRDTPQDVNSELYQGYRQGNPNNIINEISTAYDFADTSSSKFAVSVWYNSTYNNYALNQPPTLIHVARSMNMVAQAFVKMVSGSQASMPLLFLKDMPKQSSKLHLDFSSLLGPVFYMWIINLLFPVILTALVYEKERHLRMMMKMHGLGDLLYWAISYFYFLAICCIYMLAFIIFGSIIGLEFFRKNNYGIQIVFYFIYINLLISFSFMCATLFTSFKTATVCGYLYVFGSGLMGVYFLQGFVDDASASSGLIFALELIPGFSLFRGLYEFSQYSFRGVYTNTKGMEWKNLNDPLNGMKTVLGIMLVEWLVFLIIAYYFEQVIASGSGVKKHPLYFLKFLYRGNKEKDVETKNLLVPNEETNIEMDRPDVAQERAVVERLRKFPDNSYSIVCDNLKKVYPARDGNPPKYAVRGFSLAIPRGECFGILGPNGAGKTSSINMMIGFLKPTSGTAFIQGLNIQTEMDQIYSCMGVCPQHDLIWEQLTGREHLFFYGRLKNLTGTALKNAVDASLRSVNLYENGVGDKLAGKYSGGMKRRLSVAISLIGNPQVVYMDEPSTGLDPASRYNLWNVVKQSKEGRAIILTTHSMEEAEALCDRLGIFVNGQLQCIGNAKELTARYGGLYVLTVTTPQSEEDEVVKLAQSLSSKAKKVYGLSGTQKFELPKDEVSIADVFIAVANAKNHLNIQAWGLADTTLEDVFVNIAKEAQGASLTLS